MLNKKPESVNKGDDKIIVDVDRAWSFVKARLENDGLIPSHQGKTRPLSLSLMRIAATILVLVALGTGAYIILSPQENQTDFAFKADRTEEFGLSLPDGSLVDLNSHSRIRYTLDETGNRMVKLNGEAFFNVVPDPEKPFIISTAKAEIMVTGTSFSVWSEPSKDRTEVYVEKGSVQFYQQSDEQSKITLESGKMGVLENNVLSMVDNNDENYLSWKTKKIIFNQTSMEEVARVLSRTYRKEIIFENSELEECLFTGTFDGWPVDSVVQVIKLALSLDVDQNRNSFVLSGQGCN
jgi:transmembrane sensor